MKFTPKTIAILKNFYSINPSILIKPGNILETVSTTDSIIAQAKTDNEFTKKFGVYDISRLLSSLSLFNADDVDLKISSKSIIMSEGKKTLEYACANEKDLPDVPEFLTFSDKVAVHLTLSAEDFQNIFKAMGVLGLPEVVIQGDGKNLSAAGMDSDGRIQDNYTLSIGTTSKTFKAIFKLDNINKILLTDYDIKMEVMSNDEGDEYYVALFTGLNEEIKYIVAMSANSEL
jgi:hypothetical protein